MRDRKSRRKVSWLGDYYIVDADTENPYVWAVDSKGRLEKRSVVLGQHDDDLSEYEIADGLKKIQYCVPIRQPGRGNADKGCI